MYIDNKLINSGNLLEDMEPSITPPKEIVDETDRKPDEWDDQERIPDENAQKPDGQCAAFDDVLLVRRRRSSRLG